MVEVQSINNILNGDIPVVTSSSEQVFLTDFMESKGDTPGGRLARWLQPDRAVDLEASELTLPTDPVKVGIPSEFTICTKDQDGKAVFVDGMKVHRVEAHFLSCFERYTTHVCDCEAVEFKSPSVQVEVKAVWLGQRKEKEESVSIRRSKVDRITGVKKPSFKKEYHSTRLNSNYLYHSISMMMVGVVNHVICQLIIILLSHAALSRLLI